MRGWLMMLIKAALIMKLQLHRGHSASPFTNGGNDWRCDIAKLLANVWGLISIKPDGKRRRKHKSIQRDIWHQTRGDGRPLCIFPGLSEQRMWILKGARAVIHQCKIVLWLLTSPTDRTKCLGSVSKANQDKKQSSWLSIKLFVLEKEKKNFYCGQNF